MSRFSHEHRPRATEGTCATAAQERAGGRRRGSPRRHGAIAVAYERTARLHDGKLARAALQPKHGRRFAIRPSETGRDGPNPILHDDNRPATDSEALRMGTTPVWRIERVADPTRHH